MAVEPHSAGDGVSAVARAGPQLSGRQKIGILGVTGGLVLVAIVVSHLMGGGGEKDLEKSNDSLISPGMPFSAPAESTPPAARSAPAPAPGVSFSFPPTPTLVPQASSGNDIALNAPIFSYSGGGAEPAALARTMGTAAGGQGGVEDELSKALKPSDLGAPAKATVMPHPDLTIPSRFLKRVRPTGTTLARNHRRLTKTWEGKVDGGKPARDRPGGAGRMISPAAPLLEYLLTPLDPWLEDPATEDIAINQPGEAWIRQRGAWLRDGVALDGDALEEIAILAGSLRKQEVGALSPLCATELPDGERLQICLPPAVPQGTVSLTIRKHEHSVAPLSKLGSRYRARGWNSWRNLRASRDMTELLALYDAGDLEGFLAAAVRARLNMLLSGRTGSGKTTLSKSVLAAIDPGERLITIEDTLELMVLQPNVVRLLYSKDGLSGAEVNAEALLQASLRMRPDRVLLQELRDDAAWTYVNEVISGHPGSITTIHGHGASEAFRRLFALAKSSRQGAALQDSTLIDLIAGAIDVIIPLEESGGVFGIGSVWFAADAARRCETAADLLRET